MFTRDDDMPRQLPKYLAEYSASEVSSVVGISAHNLRDWRRRGLLINYGEQGENKVWRYSVLDLTALWVVKNLNDLAEFSRARGVAYFVLSSVSLAKFKLGIKHYDYALSEIDLGDECIFIGHYPGGHQSVLKLRSFASAPKGFIRAEVFNISEMFSSMPVDLKEAVFTASSSNLEHYPERGEKVTRGKEVAKALSENRPQQTPKGA
ncbi:MAG: helix-turn-helix domain-containing protein [Marivita sp.]|uniref:MerR family transcriptional regulator n=1 Tax=Marivita sp. TaxID=2003365 RepID=UPI0025C1C031|nr:MerR family transcriptional regulator [Marivita sp.]MCI5110410.1 helix-turn-helix domain-containing protein [Marivita sp.]